MERKDTKLDPLYQGGASKGTNNDENSKDLKDDSRSSSLTPVGPLKREKIPGHPSDLDLSPNSSRFSAPSFSGVDFANDMETRGTMGLFVLWSHLSTGRLRCHPSVLGVRCDDLIRELNREIPSKRIALNMQIIAEAVESMKRKFGIKLFNSIGYTHKFKRVWRLGISNEIPSVTINYVFFELRDCVFLKPSRKIERVGLIMFYEEETHSGTGTWAYEWYLSDFSKTQKVFWSPVGAEYLILIEDKNLVVLFRGKKVYEYVDYYSCGNLAGKVERRSYPALEITKFLAFPGSSNLIPSGRELFRQFKFSLGPDVRTLKLSFVRGVSWPEKRMRLLLRLLISWKRLDDFRNLFAPKEMFIQFKFNEDKCSSPEFVHFIWFLHWLLYQESPFNLMSKDVLIFCIVPFFDEVHFVQSGEELRALEMLEKYQYPYGDSKSFWKFRSITMEKELRFEFDENSGTFWSFLVKINHIVHTFSSSVYGTEDPYSKGGFDTVRFVKIQQKMQDSEWLLETFKVLEHKFVIDPVFICEYVLQFKHFQSFSPYCWDKMVRMVVKHFNNLVIFLEKSYGFVEFEKLLVNLPVIEFYTESLKQCALLRDSEDNTDFVRDIIVFLSTVLNKLIDLPSDNQKLGTMISSLSTLLEKSIDQSFKLVGIAKEVNLQYSRIENFVHEFLVFCQNVCRNTFLLTESLVSKLSRYLHALYDVIGTGKKNHSFYSISQSPVYFRAGGNLWSIMFEILRNIIHTKNEKLKFIVFSESHFFPKSLYKDDCKKNFRRDLVSWSKEVLQFVLLHGETRKNIAPEISIQSSLWKVLRILKDYQVVDIEEIEPLCEVMDLLFSVNDAQKEHHFGINEYFELLRLLCGVLEITPFRFRKYEIEGNFEKLSICFEHTISKIVVLMGDTEKFSQQLNELMFRTVPKFCVVQSISKNGYVDVVYMFSISQHILPLKGILSSWVKCVSDLDISKEQQNMVEAGKNLLEFCNFVEIIKTSKDKCKSNKEELITASSTDEIIKWVLGFYYKSRDSHKIWNLLHDDDEFVQILIKKHDIVVSQSKNSCHEQVFRGVLVAWCRTIEALDQVMVKLQVKIRPVLVSLFMNILCIPCLVDLDKRAKWDLFDYEEKLYIGQVLKMSTILLKQVDFSPNDDETVLTLLIYRHVSKFVCKFLEKTLGESIMVCAMENLNCLLRKFIENTKTSKQNNNSPGKFVNDMAEMTESVLKQMKRSFESYSVFGPKFFEQIIEFFEIVLSSKVEGVTSLESSVRMLSEFSLLKLKNTKMYKELVDRLYELIKSIIISNSDSREKIFSFIDINDISSLNYVIYNEIKDDWKRIMDISITAFRYSEKKELIENILSAIEIKLSEKRTLKICEKVFVEFVEVLQEMKILDILLSVSVSSFKSILVVLDKSVLEQVKEIFKVEGHGVKIEFRKVLAEIEIGGAKKRKVNKFGTQEMGSSIEDIIGSGESVDLVDIDCNWGNSPKFELGTEKTEKSPEQSSGLPQAEVKTGNEENENQFLEDVFSFDLGFLEENTITTETIDSGNLSLFRFEGMKTKKKAT